MLSEVIRELRREHLPTIILENGIELHQQNVSIPEDYQSIISDKEPQSHHLILTNGKTTAFREQSQRSPEKK